MVSDTKRPLDSDALAHLSSVPFAVIPIQGMGGGAVDHDCVYLGGDGVIRSAHCYESLPVLCESNCHSE